MRGRTQSKRFTLPVLSCVAYEVWRTAPHLHPQRISHYHARRRLFRHGSRGLARDSAANTCLVKQSWHRTRPHPLVQSCHRRT